MPDQNVHNITVDGAIIMSEHASVVKRSEDRIVGFVETERQGVVRSSAHLVNDGIQSELAGAAPQNEADSLIAASILVKKLNLLGATWSTPRIALEPADCEAADEQQPDTVLHMQVTRVTPVDDFWRELNTTGSVAIVSDQAKLIAAVKTAIEKKVARLPLAERASLVLALDANRLPALILTAFQERAIADLKPICSRAGFASVWVVGPTSETTYVLHTGNA